MTKSKLIILIVLNAFELDGPGLLLENHCRQWANNPELEIQVIALSRDGALRERLEALGVSAAFRPARTPAQWFTFWRWLKQLGQSRDAPYLIHTHLLWPDLAMRFFRTAVPGVPLVSTCHGLHALREKGSAKGAVYQLLDRATRFRCDHWVAVSKNVARKLVRYGVAKKRISVASNGIDLQKFAPFNDDQRSTARALFGVKEDDFLILSVGNLRPVKGFDIALRAVEILRQKHDNIRLLIIGSGPLLGDLQALCDELNLRDSVEFRGPVTTLEKLYGGADCYLQPSRYESFGLAVAEAMACNVPVVCSQTGALPELVKQEKTGRLFPVDDALACANEIGACIIQKAENRQMVENARQHVEKHADIVRSANKVIAVWKRLIEAS